MYWALTSSTVGLWGTCPLDFQLFNLSGHFRAAPSLKFVSVWLPIQRRIYWPIAVQCMDFIIFCVSPLNSFIFLSCPSSHLRYVTMTWNRLVLNLFCSVLLLDIIIRTLGRRKPVAPIWFVGNVQFVHVHSWRMEAVEPSVTNLVQLRVPWTSGWSFPALLHGCGVSRRTAIFSSLQTSLCLSETFWASGLTNG